MGGFLNVGPYCTVHLTVHLIADLLHVYNPTTYFCFNVQDDNRNLVAIWGTAKLGAIKKSLFVK